MDKAIKQEAVVFMPDRQSPKTVQPTDRAFDDPASLVAAHASAIIGRFLDPVAPMGTDDDDVLFLHLVPQRIAVVGAIQDHGRFDWQRHAFRNRGQNRSEQFRLCFVRRRRDDTDRHTGSLNGNFDLHPFAYLGFTDFLPPFCAGVKVASANNSSVSKSLASSNSSTTICQTFSQMPSAVHSAWRRQHVAGDGNSEGMSRQRQPLRKTKIIAAKQAWSEARGRPPNRLGSYTGNSGLTRSQSRSVKIRSRSSVGMADLLSANKFSWKQKLCQHQF